MKTRKSLENLLLDLEAELKLRRVLDDELQSILDSIRALVKEEKFEDWIDWGGGESCAGGS